MQKDAFYIELCNSGIIIEDADTVHIEKTVKIGKGTVIEPNNVLKGKTVIGKNVKLKSGNYIEDGIIEDDCQIMLSRVNSSSVGRASQIGPFSHLRPCSLIGEECRIGNFVEIKNSTIGNKTKIAHLSYVGDAVIGSCVNIGCGVVTVNYDGKLKHKTIIEDHAFVGSNVNLVAPVKVGKGAVIAAGSTITEDVPALALGIARSRQANKMDYKKHNP